MFYKFTKSITQALKIGDMQKVIFSKQLQALDHTHDLGNNPDLVSLTKTK